MKIDWAKKLTSRKFWLAVAALVASIMAMVGADDAVITQVTALITAAATVVAYIVGEGLVDAAKVQPESTQDQESVSD